MLISGYEGSDWEERLIYPITTKVLRDVVLRFWRYADFTLDHELAQQLNFELQILESAKEKGCENIAKLGAVSLTNYAVMYEIKRYDMDLRTYLKKHHDYRKINEILLQVVEGLK